MDKISNKTQRNDDDDDNKNYSNPIKLVSIVYVLAQKP
jgi:hypothetical protein